MSGLYDGLKFGKGQPPKVRRKARRAARVAFDEAESAKAKTREHARCRVCWQPGAHTHHLKGRRGPLETLQAKWKVYLCPNCHLDVHGRLHARTRLLIHILTDADDPHGLEFEQVERDLAA